MSHTLDFEILYDLKWFAVSFETESPLDNWINSVTMEGYPICDVTLRNSHKILFHMIETRMRKEAEIFWNKASEDRKEKFAKMPNVSAMMEMVNEQILKPYNQAIVNADSNPFL